MLQATTLIGLFLVICVYGISVVGIKKYEVITTLMMLRKKEILGLVLCIGIVFLGILMQVSRNPMSIEGGLITSTIGNVTDVFFAGSASISSFAVLLVTMIPAYVFQVFAVSKIVAKLNIPYAQLFFYMIIYALNIGLYSQMIFSAGEAIIYLLLSAFIYYFVMVMTRIRGKKDYVYILGYVVLLGVTVFLEKNINWTVILLSILTMIESVIMAFYLGKSIILRRTLRKAGVIILLLGYVWINANVVVEDESWTVTQHGDPNGNVMSCYTIVNEKNELIIIDGGYDTDAEWVREIIREHDNHVSAWIISHPHPDHAGAFNEIMKNNTQIKVDNIYTIEVNYNRYKETAQDYDRFDVYEDFLEITSELDNVTYLKENDELEVVGLHMKVLHAWDEHTEGLDVNLLNNGSMLFVLEGDDDSMLFCSDVENETEAVILENHIDELNVDYIQLGHHGNWGMTRHFYDNINPKGVFFDAPNWIVDNEDGAYDAWQLKDYFEGRDIKVYQFQEIENQVVLE